MVEFGLACLIEFGLVWFAYFRTNKQIELFLFHLIGILSVAFVNKKERKKERKKTRTQRDKEEKEQER